MRTVAVDGTPAAPAITISLSVPMADAVLISHQMSLLNQALPDLKKPPQTLELAISQMAAAVTQNTNDNRIARDERDLREQEPKLPSQKF
jgi:hypothetical protein